MQKEPKSIKVVTYYLAVLSNKCSKFFAGLVKKYESKACYLM